MKRSSLFTGLVLALSLSACNSPAINGVNPNQPSDTPSSVQPGQNNGKGLFSSAISKRTLPLPATTQSANVNVGSSQQGRNQDNTAGATAPNAAPMPNAPMAESAGGFGGASPSAAGRMVGDKMSIWAGPGEFNNYTMQYAEESVFPGSQAGSLLQAHRQTVAPIATEWDAEARLVESRANLTNNGNDSTLEYIYLPGKDPDKSEQLRPDYVFRYASSRLKETLNIYVMKNETRVHRIIWGEPQIDLNKVKIDSAQALETARKAFTDRSDNPGYPVYPEKQYLDPTNNKVLYDAPSDANWQIYLNQYDTNSRYFVNFNYETEVQPIRNPNVPGQPNSGSPPDKVKQWVGGSVEIDAITGQIKSVNRPVLYTPVYYTGVGRTEPAVAVNAPVAVDAAAPDIS